MKTSTFTIPDMNCASCVAHIEGDLSKTKGVKQVRVNFATDTAIVEHDESLTPNDIIRVVKETGYTAIPQMDHHHGDHAGMDHHDHVQAEDSGRLKKRFFTLLFAIVVTVVMLLLMFALHVGHHMIWMFLLATAVVVFPSQEFFKRGFPSFFKKGRPNMDTLVALGVVAAYAFSVVNVFILKGMDEYFMDVAFITTFILMGRYLEERAKGRASAAIKRLLELSAKRAHVIQENGEVVDVPVDQVHVGQVLLVKPGEKVPADGEIIEGHAILDESMITGESIPVEKQLGDYVIGATINGTTSFKFRAQKVGAQSLLARIIAMVQEAQSSKAPIQQLADTISKYFVWVVILISVVTFIAWWFLPFGGLTKAALVAVTVIVIACPCALGLATPISVVVGTGRGAALGILFKNAESLQKAQKITTILFDKTGTITKGKPEVVDIIGGEEVLALAYALEQYSEHPLAQAVIKKAKSIGIPLQAVSEFSSIVGKGVEGAINEKFYLLGNQALLKDAGIQLTQEQSDQIAAAEAKGQTVLLLASQKEFLGALQVADTIKEFSQKAVHELHQLGIKTMMLTGDNELTAQAISDQVGIDRYEARLLPEDKLRIVTELQAGGEVVAMVGDGINDSPALAKADVGIAIGTGTDIAIESGDIVLVHGDLLKAVEAIRLSSATLKNIKQNLFWAFFYNLIAIPVAVLGLLNPAISSAAMAFSSISVVLNALRLRRFK